MEEMRNKKYKIFRKQKNVNTLNVNKLHFPIKDRDWKNG